MQSQIQWPAGPPPAVQPEFTRIGDDRIIGSTTWPGAAGRRHERYQVLTLRDGRIVDIQDCSSERQARRFALR